VASFIHSFILSKAAVLSLFAAMPSEYQPVPEEDEKYQDVFIARRPSISTSDSTLLCDEDAKSSEQRRRSDSKWMWLVHAVLLSLSFTMFSAAYFKPVSTLEHVRHFSAYCEFVHRQGRLGLILNPQHLRQRLWNIKR
jgi:hypothetical protein